MKSINEFATKYAQDKYLPVQTYNAVKAGANYVLREVEKIFSKANKYKDGSDHTILYLDIEFLVKQLKK